MHILYELPSKEVLHIFPKVIVNKIRYIRLIKFGIFAPIKFLAIRNKTVTRIRLKKKFHTRFIHLDVIGNFSAMCLSHSSTYFWFCSLSGNC